MALMDFIKKQFIDAKDIYRRCPDGRWRIYERRIEVVFETDEHRQG